MKGNRCLTVLVLGGVAIVTAGASAQTIYTPYAFTNFAGQPGGPGIADGPGRGARFKSPTGTATDGAGNVYVADQLNFTIRKITPGGAVTTIAGSPGAPGTGDGVGSAARFGTIFGGPTAIAVDAATNIYVADTPNYTVRKISLVGTNWTVSTFAGSAGHSGTNDDVGGAARFGGPSGMAVDKVGNIYMADGFAIRRITPAGVVTTLAGSVLQAGAVDGTNAAARFGSTFFGGPKGVTVDSGTNIYVADTYNNTIRKVAQVGTNWVTTILVGTPGFLGFADGTNGVALFDNPYGIASDNSGNIYVSDPPAQTIRRIRFDGTNRVATTLAGTVVAFGSDDGFGNAARFQTPDGLSVDTSGNIYVADFGNNEIRKITPAGAVTTLAGQAGGPGLADGAGNAAQFQIPHSAAVDIAGNVYVGDTFNHTVRKITPAGEVTTVAGVPGNQGYADGVGTAQSVRFNSAIGISADAAGNLFVADTGNQTIRKVTPGGVTTTIAGQIGVNGSANGVGSAATFNSPQGTAVDKSGNVYVADMVNRTIRMITPGGVVTTLAGSTSLQATNDGIGSAARFTSPSAVAVDGATNVYVADQGGNTIRKIAPGGIVTTLAGLGKISGTNDGIGPAARFLGPQGVAVDSAGNVFVSDSGNHTIRMVTPNGTVTTIAGVAGNRGGSDGTNATAQFDTPRGITVDTAGIVYVSDSVNSTIRKITHIGTNWVVTTLAGTAGENGSVDATGPAARFHFIYGLTVDGLGNLFAMDRSNDDIRKITPAGVVTTFAGASGQPGSTDGVGAAAQFYGPEELTVDNAGNIYVVEFFNNTVRKIAPVGTNWVVTTLAGCPSCPPGTNDGVGSAARFNGPFGLTKDSSGNLYVADTGNVTVRKLSKSGTNWIVTTFAGAPKQQGATDATGINARLNGPLGLASDKFDNLYLTDGFAIRKITLGAVVTTLAGCPPPSCTNALGSADGPGSAARFDAPRGIAVDDNGNLYVADVGNDTIRKLTLSGGNWMVTTLGGVPGQASGADGVGPGARFNNPTGVAVDLAGNVYVVDTGENRVTKGVPFVAGSDLRFDTGNSSLAVSNGVFQARLSATTNGNVIVEASIDLVHWSPLLTNALPLSLSVPLGTNSYRFFRARIAP